MGKGKKGKKEGQGYVWTQKGSAVPIPDLSPLIAFQAQMVVVKEVKKVIESAG